MTKRRKFIIIIAAAFLAAAGAVIAWLLLRSEGYHPFSSLSASDIALCHADGATSYTETAEGEKASMPAVYMLTQEETDELLTLMHKITYEKNDDGEDNDLVGIPYKYFTVELKNGEKIRINLGVPDGIYLIDNRKHKACNDLDEELTELYDRCIENLKRSMENDDGNVKTEIKT